MPSGVFSLKQVNQALTQGAWSNQKPVNVDYLVVAGGAGGGGSGAGGGAGGLLQGNIPVTSGASITVTIGGGGSGGVAAASRGSSGNNSVFGSLTAVGGGGGGSWNAVTTNAYSSGASGGSGGGSAGGYSATYPNGFPGSGTSGQGNNGGVTTSAFGQPYTSGGGGGAGTAGGLTITSTAGNGGAGISSDISGTRTAYAGGGSGGAAGSTGTPGGIGGVGGGGSTNTVYTNATGNGTANTGGGGAGGWGSNGGTGGSGIVILSYPDIYQAAASTTGSPTVSTSGSGSLSLNGATSFRYAGQSAFVFGTGDFTIEMWLYTTTSGTLMIPLDFRPGLNGAYPYIFKNTDNKMYYYVDTATRITSTNTIPNGSWFHFVICRSGTSTKMFINGVQEGSTWTDTTNYICGNPGPTFFSDGATSYFWTGNATNVRIVKGTALYTSNFTVPTAPLTAVSGTSLLLNANSGAYLADSSANSFVPGNNPGAGLTWNQLSPFATGLGYKNRVYTWTSSGSITF
jgi:hypothetical protein